MASFCMERLLFVKKFTLYFRRLNFFLWSIVTVLLLQQVHCQKPPVYTAESCSNESVFLFFSTKSEQTAIQQSHIINPLLTSFARSVREIIAFGFYRTDLAPSSLGLYENLRQYSPVQTSHSVNKSLLQSLLAAVSAVKNSGESSDLELEFKVLFFSVLIKAKIYIYIFIIWLR